MEKIYRVTEGNEYLVTNELIFFEGNNIISSLGHKIPVGIALNGLKFIEVQGYQIERNPTSTRIILAPQGIGKIFKDNLNILHRFGFNKLVLHDNVSEQDFEVRPHEHYLIFFNQVSACALELVGDNYKWEEDRQAFRLYPTEEYDKTWSLKAYD